MFQEKKNELFYCFFIVGMAVKVFVLKCSLLPRKVICILLE